MIKHLHILRISTGKIWESLGSQNEKHLKMFKKYSENCCQGLHTYFLKTWTIFKRWFNKNFTKIAVQTENEQVKCMFNLIANKEKAS